MRPRLWRIHGAASPIAKRTENKFVVTTAVLFVRSFVRLTDEAWWMCRLGKSNGIDLVLGTQGLGEGVGEISKDGKNNLLVNLYFPVTSAARPQNSPPKKFVICPATSIVPISVGLSFTACSRYTGRNFCRPAAAPVWMKYKPFSTHRCFAAALAALASSSVT